MDKQFSDAYEHMRKTLDENTDRPEESTVDYLYRNFMAADDEEYQTFAEEGLDPEVEDALRQELDDNVAEEIVTAINAFYAGKVDSSRVLELLRPHVSNPEGEKDEDCT